MAQTLDTDGEGSHVQSGGRLFIGSVFKAR